MPTGRGDRQGGDRPAVPADVGEVLDRVTGVLARAPGHGKSATLGLVLLLIAAAALVWLAEALAVELAPIRVVAVSPGIVDSGSWDGLGADRDAFFADTAAKNPARRIGSTTDIAEAVEFALTNRFLTGTVLHIDGGARIA